MNCQPRVFFPTVGQIVPGIAAGFLYQTDCKVSFIENLISNPKSAQFERNQALDLIVTAILKESDALGFYVVMGFTQVPGVVRRAVKLGFQKTEKQYTLVSKGVGLWAL